MDNNQKRSTTLSQFQCYNDEIFSDKENQNLNCQSCLNDIVLNEIVYYCGCSRLFHPNCLKTKRQCDICQSGYKLGTYDNESERNNSTIDTNINNLENYSEIYNMAIHLSHEGLIDRVNKDSNITFDEGRIALSPIDMSNTPYSGKTKSGQKVGDYFKLQNTHTTPHNKSQIINGHSPISLNGIRQHLSFYSPNNNESPQNKKLSFDNYYTYFTKNEFRKIIFEEDENESDFSIDKENQPPIPRESSKYTYSENDIGPVEINLEAGMSHIVSDTNKVVEIPISFEIKVDNDQQSYSKDFIIVFNTKSKIFFNYLVLNIESIYQIIRNTFMKLSHNDRIFINILTIDKWLTKTELAALLELDVFCSICMKDSTYLNNTELIQMLNYCIDISFEFHSNIFSIILVNDVDDIYSQDYLEDIKIISNKIKETQVSVLKNFTINSIILNRNESNVKSISFYYELAMLTHGYFYAPKDYNELLKSMNILLCTIEQTSCINLKAVVKGNKDPSIYIDCLNYPSLKHSHNYLEIYLGNLTRKEKKNISLLAVVILNNQNVSLDLPLLEVNLEYIATNPINEYCNNTTSNIIKRKTNSYCISIPIIPFYKDITYSNATYIKYLCAKIADYLKLSIESLKQGKEDECLLTLYEARQFYENIRSITPLFKFVDNSYYSMSESKFINDDSIIEILKNMKSANHYKMFHFSMMILMDINELIEKVKNKNIQISQFYTIMQSLSYIRPVNLKDDRFIDDIIDLN